MMKDELRLKMREKRRNMTTDEVKEKSAVIQDALFSLDCFKNADTACTFISAFKEPDTAAIIKRLLFDGKKVVVPVTDTDNTTLILSYIEDMSDLEKGAFGILEPTAIKPASESDIDAVLVPGLAFDIRGGRMGFGKGYYDRFLEKTDAVKIALCYDFQLFDKIPTEPHDVPMDIIITENGITEVKND